MKLKFMFGGRLLRISLVLGITLLNAWAQTNVPVITALSPLAGAMGASVTLSGQNFSPVEASNTVYFGPVQAVVTAANATSLTVSVPAGATYVPVTETTGGLTAASTVPFLPEFPGGAAFGSKSLGPQFTLPTGVSAGSSCLGDLDGDGKPDLVVVADDQHIYIYRNISTNGTLVASSFAPALALPIPVKPGGNFGMIQAVDLTGDGKLDLVTADFNNNELIVLKNTAPPGSLTTNSFAPAVFFPTGPTPIGVAVGDLDGDGLPDIVTTANGGSTITVFRNLSQPGVFTTNSLAAPATFPVANSPKMVALADIDGDGKLDVVMTHSINSVNQGMSVSRNISTPGNIAFATNVLFSASYGSLSLAVGDVDGDGKLDVVVAAFNGKVISVYRNTSTPGSITANSFAPRVDIQTAGWANWVAIADLDGDGKPDLAVAEQLPSQMEVFRNLSTPGCFTNSSLAPPVAFPTGQNPNSVVIGDLDGDGRPDIALVNDYNYSVTVYQNLVPFGKAPVITAQPASQTAVAGGQVTFTVAASGSVGLAYQWSFDGTNIAGATNATLTLDNVQPVSSGTYQATVANSYGTTTSSNAILTVELPPSIVEQPQSETVLSYGSANFTVVAGGSGPFTYQWIKNGVALADGGNVSGSATPILNLATVSLSDAGNYEVQVSNAFAKTNSAMAVLTVPQTVLSLGSTNAMSGDLVTIPVWLNALGVENIFSTSVGYDPAKLVLQGVQLGQADSGAYLQEIDSQTNNGYVGFAVYFSGVLPTGPLQVAQLVFQALPVTNTATVNLTLGDFPTPRQLVDDIGDALPFLSQNGTVTLTPAEYEADVYPRFNGDHQVNLQDWLEEGRFVAGLDVPTNSDELLRADCAPRNAPDGVLTVADWVQAGRYALGLDPLTLVGVPANPNIHAQPLGLTVSTRTLQIATVSALRGQNVSVPVQLVCTTNENAAGLTVTFNPALLNLTGITLGSAMVGGRLNFNTNVTGKVGLVLALPPGYSLPAGTNQVAMLQFFTHTNAANGLPLTLDGSVVALQVADKTANALTVNYVSGAVVAPASPTLQATAQGGKLSLSWPVGLGTYQVFSAASPAGPWQPLSAAIATNGPNVLVTVPATNRQQYFRLSGQ